MTSDLLRDLSGLSAALNEELRKFFSWQDDNQPERRIKTAVMLTQPAGPGPALPSDVIGDEISSWMRSHDYFNSVAHGGKRAEREEFVGKLYSVEDILLRRVSPRPLSDLDEIDALIQEGEMPTNDQVDRALELVQRSGGNYQYFFEKLTSPAWIEPLAKRGRFADPPNAERVGDMYRFPRWPEGDYLLRMAPIAPEVVSGVITDECFASDNPLVDLLLIEIGSALPGPQARSIAQREKRWVELNFPCLRSIRRKQPLL